MNEIKPHIAELIAKMDAEWAKKGNTGKPDVIISTNRDFIEGYYKHLEDLSKSKHYM